MPAIKDILIQGGKQQKVLEMTYKKKDGSVVKRKVEPYEIRGDVFWGWDTNDDHIKRFVIWRIRDAKVTKDSFDPRFDIKMSKAGGVTAKSMTSSLEITLNGLKGALNESSKDLDEVHSIRRELTSLQQMLAEAGKGDFVLGKDSGEWYEYAHEQYGVKDAKDVNPAMMNIAKETVEDFKRNIKLWKDIRIGFAESLGGALGRFLSGSASSTPVIMLSEKSILSGMKKYNVTIDDAISPTVIHELGHAMCELDRDFFNDEYIQVPNKRDEEKWVEEFAREYYDYSHIPEGVKKLVKAMKKMNEDIDLNKLPDDVYELPDTSGITKVGEALTKQIHGSVYRMRRIEHKRFGTVYAVWYRTYLPAYYSPKDGFIHSGGDTTLTGEVKKKTEWLVGLYNKIYKDGVKPGGEHEVNEATEPLVNTKRFADDEGRIILYRGTSGKGGGFEQGDLGSGLYVTPNKGMAQAYAGMHKAGGELVFYQLNPKAKMLNSDSKVWLDIKDEFNLGVLDKVPAHKKLCDAIQKKVLGAGYDGVASWDMATGWVIMNEKVLTEIWRDRINGE